MDIKANPYSNLKVFDHHDKLVSLKKGERTGPLYVRIKPTNICNHHCNYCSYADSDLALRDDVNVKDQIPWIKMEEIINDLHAIGVKAITFSGGGDPLVYPHILEAINLLLDKKIQISIITNGQLLSDEIANALADAHWVRISLDSANSETYSKIRNIPLESFNKVCKNIETFAKIKNKDCEFGINFVINHENYNQIYDAAKMLKKLGVNHIKYAARITKDLDKYHKTFKEIAIAQIHEAEALKSENFSIINKYEHDFEFSTVFKRIYCNCHVKEFVTVIAADSKVYFCHDKAYVKSGVVGDLKNTSFKKLWFSPDIQKRYKEFDASKECNHHCVYDDRNMLLNTYLSLDQHHINFI